MSSYVTRKTPGDNAWFTRDRFGMFIHWGLYSMPACVEWIKSNECLSEEEYDTYLRYFDPDLYDPREWAKAAKAAGRGGAFPRHMTDAGNKKRLLRRMIGSFNLASIFVRIMSL